jgi:hypothetical protein
MNELLAALPKLRLLYDGRPLCFSGFNPTLKSVGFIKTDIAVERGRPQIHAVTSVFLLHKLQHGY